MLVNVAAEFDCQMAEESLPISVLPATVVTTVADYVRQHSLRLLEP